MLLFSVYYIVVDGWLMVLLLCELVVFYVGGIDGVWLLLLWLGYVDYVVCECVL